MRTARLIHIIRQIGSLAVTAVTAASTLNAYRPLARSGYPSLFSWTFGLVVTELPLQTLVSQLGGLALTARRLTRPVRTVAWLVAGVSALGLLNFSRAGHQANVPLTAALDNGLGTDRRTESAGLWRRPAGAGTAKAPGLLRMLRIYRDYAHDPEHQLRRIRQRQPPGHLATSRSRSERKGAGAVPDPRRRLDDGKQTRTGPSVDEPPRRAGLDLRGDQLPAQPAQHLARPHRRRQARPRVGQGAHRRVRRRPRLHRHHRRFGRRPPVVAGGADAQRPTVPARIRRCRHPGAGGRAVLRRLRLHPLRRRDACR